MAAILLLRRGTTPSTTQTEPYFNTQKDTLQIGTGVGTVTLAKMDSINTGSFYISGNITASNILVSENITLGGTIILGDNSSSDEIIVNASLSGSIIPETTSVYDLGTSVKKYRNLFVVSASIDSISLPGSGILSSSNITFASYTGSTNEFTSSINSKFVTLASYTSSINSDLNKLHLYTQSNDLDITELFSTASDHADDIYSLQVTSSLHNSRISELETTSSYLATTVSQSVDFRLDEVESTSSYLNTSFSQSVYSDFYELFYSSSDHESRIDSLESIDYSYGIRINNLESFSSSEEGKNSTLADYTGSINNKFITLSSTTSSILEFTSSQESKNLTIGTTTASLQSFTASEESKNLTLAAYTASVDGKFLSLQNYTSSVSNSIYYLNDYSQSLKDAIDVNGQNIIIFGDLTVQGTTTTLNTTELVIEDKVLSLASGSTTSAQADGSGLHISGANVSILWKDNETLLHTNSKLSSSYGFKGDGSELTNIQHSNISFNGSGLVSGSSQVTSSLDFRYLMIEGDLVVSGSSQIDLTQTTNYVSGIKNRLNAEGVLSGSSQITNGSGLLSSSNENFEQFSSSVDFRLDTLQLFTASEESKNSTLAAYTASVDGKFLSLQNYTSSVDGKFLSLENYTASVNSDLNSLHSYTQSNDTNVNNLFNTASQYYSFSSSIQTIVKNKINTEGVVSSSSDSATIDFTITNGVISGNVIGGIISSSNQLTSSLDSLYEVSGSVADLIGIRTTSGSLGSAAWYNVSSSISDGNPAVLGSAGAVKDYIDEQLLVVGAGDITAVVAGNGISGGAVSGPATLSLDTSSAHFINGVNSTISTFSQSVDTRLDSLESFSSSLDSGFVTQQELGSATGSLINSIATKLNTGSYNTDSQSFDSRINNLTESVFTHVVTDSGGVFVIDSISQPILSFVPGATYRFNTSAVEGSHPFKFSTSVDGPTQYTTGVISGSNFIQIEVNYDTPTKLYYYCAHHSGMGNEINTLRIDTLTTTSSFNSFTSLVNTATSSLNSFTSSINSTIKSKLNTDGVISGSSQLPSGIISGSSQLPSGIISGSSQLPSGIISSSAQISASGFVSSSNVSIIQTITSASYAALTPVSGTLYIIIG